MATTNQVNGWRDLRGSGNPNGVVAGNLADQYFDTTNGVLYQCSATGTTTTAVWVSIAGSATAANPSVIMGLAAVGSNQTGTYNNTTGTFTYTATGAQSYDGQTPTVGSGTNPVYTSVVLLIAQSNTFQNGIYYVSTLGATGVSQVLTRHPLANTAALINNNSRFYATAGSQYARITFQLRTPIVTLGTDAIVYGFGSLSFGTITNGGIVTVLGGLASTTTVLPAVSLTTNSVSASQAITANSAWLVTGTTQITLTLPAAAIVGNWIRILSPAARFTIAQIASASIVYGVQTTATGTGGSITSNNAGASIDLFAVSSTQWQVTASTSNFTVV